MREPTDEEMAVCFGTKTKCPLNCRMKEYCRDEAKEKMKEKRRKQFRESQYIDEMDATSDKHSVNRDYLAEQEHVEEASTSEVNSAISSMDLPESVREKLKRLYANQERREAERENMKDMLHRLGELYVFDPMGFEVLFFKILNGCNQSALAKMHKCTKQNISKKLVKGKERMAAYRKAMDGGKMSERELSVYYFVCVKKMSCRKAAESLGIGKTAVWKTIKKLANHNINADKKRKAK